MTTGRALDREACAAHALEVRCSDGQLWSTARVHVRLRDLNDHAPAFERRFYDVRAPAPPPPPPPPPPPQVRSFLTTMRLQNYTEKPSKMD